ncbi:MAG: hypothetical protein WC217_01870 [Candidatus Paceibacterota bacterium]|jgi:hypothetical protein
MTSCQSLHEWVRTLETHRFPFDAKLIPKNGIYFLFEKGERGHGGARIVRVGTHTGEGQLLSRLKQHFVTPNKDRSIFRKNIGRALLACDSDPFLSDWEIDLTPAVARAEHGRRIDTKKLESVEKRVSNYLQQNMSFAVVSVDTKEERLRLESRVISTISLCDDCKPSKTWLGNSSPKEKIRESGLWIVNELYKKPLNDKDFIDLKKAVL